MRRISFPLLLLASTLLFGTASANPSAPTVSRIAKLARASLVIPQDWDGIWAVEDSVYLCDGTFQSAPGSAPDTICGGSDYQASGPVTLDCNGTADATTISVTCTGSGVFIPDCNANYTVVTHGTRSGDSYFTVTTVDVTYTGAGCEGFPAMHPGQQPWHPHGPGARGGCAATPTRRSTWGEIKAIYR